jgi:predicted component of type VI protein secretion system
MAVDSTEVELRAAVPLEVIQTGSAPEPGLFLIHRGLSYPISASGLVIGRGREPTALAIDDDLDAGAPRHAAVLHHNGTYCLKQLESPDGILYKGLRIDNKRIEEGDVFEIGDHELRFTYRAGG